MFKIKGLIWIVALVCVLVVTVISVIIRAAKKGGIRKFLERSGISFNALLQAAESGHYVAIDNGGKQLHLAIYSKKKKAYQSKTFAFDQVESFDVYHNGIPIVRMNEAQNELKEISLAGTGLISVRLYIKGIQLPYLMKLDFIAQGNGSAISNSSLERNANSWISSFHEIIASQE